MGMIINPSRFGSSALPFIFGPNGAGAGNELSSANSMRGIGFLAASSGTLKSLHIRGSSTTATNAQFRLVIYAATSSSSWGSKLGESILNHSLGAGEQRDLPLLAPVSITAGNWYALCLQSDSTFRWRYESLTGGRSYSDTFSDGAAATASSTADAGTYPVLWGSNDIVDPTSASFTLGPTGTLSGVSHTTGNTYGRAILSNFTGTINYITLVGGVSSSSVDYRVLIYEASSPTVWGNKVGESAVQNGLTASTAKKIALSSPVSVTAGNYYAVCFQPSGTMSLSSSDGNSAGGGDGRFFTDSYADGALATAGTTSGLVSPPAIYASTA